MQAEQEAMVAMESHHKDVVESINQDLATFEAKMEKVAAKGRKSIAQVVRRRDLEDDRDVVGGMICYC